MVNESVFKELIRLGYSKEKKKRVWELSSPDLFYSSPDLAQAFLNLKNFPIYRERIIERELDLMKESAAALKKVLGNQPFNLIDLHCANDDRVVRFINLLGPKVKIRYCPVNISPFLTQQASAVVRNARLPHVIIHKPQHVPSSDWATTISMLRGTNYQRNVVLLLGSSLAFFEINDFLFNLSKEWFRGDFLVIGNGVRTGKRLVHLEIYKDTLFHQWYIHLMHGLGFKDEEVRYDARFGNSRVECFYTLLTDKTIQHAEKSVVFKKGDEILVAVIYKYYARELENFCRMYFPEGEFLTDEEREYALVVCTK